MPAQPPAAPPAPPTPQVPPTTGGDLGAILQQMGQSIASIPEKVADAVREQTPAPPAPPTPSPTTGDAGSKSRGNKVVNWWFGNKG